MKRIKAECVFAGGAVLAEGPVWDEQAQLLYWVDIERGKICRFHPAFQSNQEWLLGTKVGFAVLAESGDMLAGTQEGLVRFSPETGRCAPYANPEPNLPNNRFNDGKCDPQGRLWAGTMSMIETETTGSLYRVDADGSINRCLTSVAISNGLAWSADKMYYIDSPTRRVDAFDFDAPSGAISNRRCVVALADGLGFPDGMTMDEEGKLWVALWEGWGVGRFDPTTGEMLAKVEAPTACVTSCCFGGPDFEVLYLTTASRDLKESERKKQPLAGGIFAAKPGVCGAPSIRFKG